jgi:hypothetical protein
MEEDSRHELRFRTVPEEEVSRVVIQGEKSMRDGELGPLGPCMAALKTKPADPSIQQWESVKGEVMRRIAGSRHGFFTTLHDRMTATDSTTLKVFYYAVVVLAVAVTAAAVAAGVFYLIEALTAEPAHAIVCLRQI